MRVVRPVDEIQPQSIAEHLSVLISSCLTLSQNPSAGYVVGVQKISTQTLKAKVFACHMIHSFQQQKLQTACEFQEIKS
jgi:hypothetical protein